MSEDDSDEAVAWPPPPSSSGRDFPPEQRASWSLAETFFGVLVGGPMYIVTYWVTTLQVLKLAVNIADHHKDWGMLYRLLGGTTQALLVLSLAGPFLLYWRLRRRHIGFAVGVLISGIVAMIFVLWTVISFVHDFRGLSLGW